MKQAVDFNHIEPHQIAIHERLVNWARWLHIRPQGLVQPMFKDYRAPRQWELPGYRISCDTLDAQMLEKIVFKLPDTHRLVLRWEYVYCHGGVSLGEVRRRTGLTAEGVQKYSRDARQMTIDTLQRRE